MTDYIIPYQSIFHYNDLDVVFEQLWADMSYFENTDSVVKLKRINNDESVNNYGYKFVDFCKDNSLLILIGRLEGSSKAT